MRTMLTETDKAVMGHQLPPGINSRIPGHAAWNVVGLGEMFRHIA